MPTGGPAFTVVVPVRDGARWLDEALDSVTAQTCRDWECVVIDDGSSDRSQEIARIWAERQPNRVVVGAHPEGANRGVAATRNRGLTDAHAPWIAFLDQDDVWDPGKLELQRSALLARPGVDVLGCVPALRYNPPAERLPLIEFWRENIARLSATGDHLSLRDFLVGSPLCMSGAVARADALREIGGFDIRLPRTSDWLAWAKIAAAGRVAILDEELVRYRIHGANDLLNLLDRPRGLGEASGEVIRLLVPWLAAKWDVPVPDAKERVVSLLVPA